MTFRTDVIFPTDVGLDLEISRLREHDNIVTRSGHTIKNPRWLNPLRVYTFTYGPKTLANIRPILTLWEAMNGTEDSFRFADPTDARSSASNSTAVANNDQTLGLTTNVNTAAVGDGATTTFQLRKAYTTGSYTYYRPIKKPRSGTVLIAKAGVGQTETTHYTINYATGVVTFLSAPASGQSITAGFHFDVEVSFVDEDLRERFRTPLIGEIGTITLREQR